MGYSHVIYKTPCPNCKGQVEYLYFGADCRGNDSSMSLRCLGCKRDFTMAEWKIIARPEIRRQARDYWKQQYEAFGPYEFSPYHPDYNFRKLPHIDD